MTSKTHILFEEENATSNFKTNRKCSSIGRRKVILLITSALLALIFTAIYYKVFFRREVSTNLIQETTEPIPRFENTLNNKLDPVRTNKKSSWNKSHRNFYDYVSIRQKRSPVQRYLLDPTASELAELRAKIRDKRTLVKFSKLENDFRKCKMEAIAHSGCMETYKNMYKIAKDISDTMEKMKEIFQDTDLQKTPNSESSSIENTVFIQEMRKLNRTLKPSSHMGDAGNNTKRKGKKIIVHEDGKQYIIEELEVEDMNPKLDVEIIDENFDKKKPFHKADLLMDEISTSKATSELLDAVTETVGKSTHFPTHITVQPNVTQGSNTTIELLPSDIRLHPENVTEGFVAPVCTVATEVTEITHSTPKAFPQHSEVVQESIVTSSLNMQTTPSTLNVTNQFQQEQKNLHDTRVTPNTNITMEDTGSTIMAKSTPKPLNLTTEYIHMNGHNVTTVFGLNTTIESLKKTDPEEISPAEQSEVTEEFYNSADLLKIEDCTNASTTKLNHSMTEEPPSVDPNFITATTTVTTTQTTRQTFETTTHSIALPTAISDLETTTIEEKCTIAKILNREGNQTTTHFTTPLTETTTQKAVSSTIEPGTLEESDIISITPNIEETQNTTHSSTQPAPKGTTIPQLETTTLSPPTPTIEQGTMNESDISTTTPNKEGDRGSTHSTMLPATKGTTIPDPDTNTLKTLIHTTKPGHLEETTTITMISTEEANQTTITEAGRRFLDSRNELESRVANKNTNMNSTLKGKCGYTDFEYKTPDEDGFNDSVPAEDNPSRVTTIADSTTWTKPAESARLISSHPLDSPNSQENMLDDHARDTVGQRPPALEASKIREKWKKKFKEAAKEQQNNSELTQQFYTELLDSLGELDHKSGPKMNPSNSTRLDKNPQILSLCELLAKQMRTKFTPAPETDDNITTTPGVQFTSRGPGFPVTGETMKASAQFLLNPNFGIPSIPVCFYITPASFRMMLQPFLSPFFGMQGMGIGGGGGGGMTAAGGISGAGGNSGNNAGGVFVIPPLFGNMQNSGGFFGHSSPTGGGSQSNIPNIFSKSATTQQQKEQQFFCTYIQNSGKQSPGFAVGNGYNNINFKLRNTFGDKTMPNEIIYSSYWNKLPEFDGTASNSADKDPFQCPLEGDVPCFGGNECVPEKKWCDSIVDCSDGSDEAACTCRKRMQEQKICDGYNDCPLGEDEIGCFGCDKFTYSCYDNTEEFELANRSTLAMCYSSKERCNGVRNCINGRDEIGCNLLVDDLTHHMAHAASASAGFLYRNHEGIWYPVCNNAQSWAREACAEELEHQEEDPIITFQKAELPGPFIEPYHIGNALFPQSCQKRERDVLTDHVAHVRCPPPKCGVIQELQSPLMRTRRRRRRRRRDTQQEDSRIVGGSYSKPLQWPFIVALYRDGDFHCGGTIFDPHWIITAAHCALGFQKHFYDVRAGMLRRSSFSSTTQIHQVSHVVVHHTYDRRTMKNDIALMRVDTPFRYNRWVKPICLPDQKRTTRNSDWIWGPEVNTICTVVGWGAIREKGDHQKEVNLPIREQCTEKDDQEAKDICAGEAVGGRDACQGDSGGPMFCRSVSNKQEWYLAGVVSHGNGCARAKEFGVYTRVALYLDWIEMALTPKYLPKVQPIQSCPGFVCIWGGRRCISQLKRCDRLVDCLGGEDEAGCIYNYIPDVGTSLNASTTLVMDGMDTNVTTNMDTSTMPTDNEETAMTGSGLDYKSLLGDDNGGVSQELDREPLDLEKENRPSATISAGTSERHEGTTDLSHIELKSMDEKEDDAVFTTIDSTTTTWMSPKSIAVESTLSFADQSTLSTLLPLPTFQLTALKNSTVKFLQEINETSTENSNFSEGTLVTSLGTTEGFGKFKADLADVTSENPTAIHKRKNATEEESSVTMQPKTMPKHIAHKFVCEKIQQIIDFSNRCDRITDCEDGTDEEGCTCRQYLKGALNILICDGKIDCEDLTDEDDCGNCNKTEFLCPLSKQCIDSKKRCDNSVDCQFKEDEKDCFALTDGKAIHLDHNKQPKLNTAGIFSRNSHGVWHVVCSYETAFHLHGAKTAEEVCSLLGFKGPLFYNATEIIRHTIIPIVPDLIGDSLPVGDSVHFFDSSKRKQVPYVGITASRSERVHNTHDECLGLFIECVPKANGTAPLKTLTAGEEITPKIIQLHSHQPSFKPISLDIFTHKKEEILDELAKLIETKKPVLVHDKLHEGIEKWHWPWLVDVYANGILHCLGVLVDKHWVLVHESCYHGWRLDVDYVTVLLGGGKSKLTLHKSPHEQIKRIDCFEVVEGCDVLLLHLDYAAHFTRHVLPTFLPVTSSTGNGSAKASDKLKLQCMSVVHDKFGGIKVTPTVGRYSTTGNIISQPRTNTSDLEPDSLVECGKDNELSCYQWDPTAIVDFKLKHFGEEEIVSSANRKEEVKTLSGFCEDLDRSSNESYSHNQGVIVCREDNTGWYPTAFYTYNASDCSNLKQPFGVKALEKHYSLIQEIIEQAKCGIHYPKPVCPTWRCPLGNCLPSDQICNGNAECHDGSDEGKEFCRLHKKECKATELKCRSNGKCIPKIKFCDHFSDCEDLTDEPTICSCFTYLQATDPDKICDGIRNCWDKSDESPVLCNCTSNRFPCGSSQSECIPKDFVCDKEPDCPNGEDEQYCYGLEHPIEIHGSKQSSLPKGFGQVTEQSYGVWHTKCFPRDKPPNRTELIEICHKLGYNSWTPPSYRLIDDSVDIVAAADIHDGSAEPAGRYRDATKAVVVNKFSPLHLNDDLTLIMKPSRPIAELVKWNATDSNNCYRLEIKCE